MPLLNLNDPEFQLEWFQLQKTEQLAVLKTLRKLRMLTWEQVYEDKGLRWELAREIAAERFYSIRVTQKCRALVRRVGDFVVFVSLHPDHDSAY
jgi:hypothetical protein